ncbi:MAG: hypothetical protein COW00_01825 [Bdellovibrio sp. CG12_big_fil_rev_8_21_14_0_65_39_13]|nr:MAG: hypothetical protein COW78_09745 [Bdellovibrio sp. CG22_combo_CG10-13_8_21_14_all_39_27]PIQ62338.1 MAG: hypothetical protein COW00_01825 [Bdellovibrio sp. CG12_big_fil_rev_8_21_14_0_65_39_13]PIR34275.1 MAG: hypothetical protein COV37_13135 [Bdellovibrio sp. CG11_big_fil_rev_8_21_14_0_20_39_38]
MKNIFFTSITISLFLFCLNPKSFAASEYTLGGSYHLNGQNTFSDDETLDLGLSMTGSILSDETNKYGITLSYNINWEENANNKVISEVVTLMPLAFFRRHFLVTGENSRFPISFYLGPNIGYAKILTPTSKEADFTFIAGGSLGMNMFLARDVSLDLLFFSMNKNFKTQQEIFNQSLGVRFYF